MANASIIEDASPTEGGKKRVSLGFQLFLSLANIVIWLAIIPIQQLLLPSQIAQIDAANKEAGLSLILFATGITGVIAQPIIGAISDRTTFRLGPRRTWLAIGVVIVSLLLVLQSFATSIAVLAIEVAVYGFAMDMLLAPILTIIPDRIPVSQRATVSAFVGLAQPVGIVIGSILIAQVIRSVQGSYYAIAGLLFVVIALFVLLDREKPLSKEELPPFSLKTFLSTFFSPLRTADFVFTWCGRFLATLSQIILVTFMLYYLKDIIHYEKLFPGQASEQGVAMFQVINTVSVVISTIITGFLSDKVQRRKPFVIAAGLIMTVALALIALIPTWTMVLVVAVLFGIGFGIFLSSDIALATQVLPEGQDVQKGQNLGKDLGLISVANVLPQVLVPLFSFLAFSVFHSYTALFIMAAVAAVLSAVFIIPIKKVR
ncbi:MFS transporter [Thermosporothrix hazakensis]|jgi:MFS family permease|uniref:MFS transporter n=1 Tax=Thermosporothrix hazakensis TaxID=644383 RepID=A0A326UHM2_THEHA|nr:MFS transporter [Thermosporothrix hazakensis]PZW36360.1 MFS transporter [Thermosporothrix hazakensis]GCE47009.1 MFS transporter [Thermosporothrix hazakensis]